MRSPTLAPSFDEPVHLVLCDFGKLGLAYTETDPMTTETAVVQHLLSGEFRSPVQVVAFSVSEGWARDVSEDIAHEVLESARENGSVIPSATRRFIERLIDEELEPELCGPG